MFTVKECIDNDTILKHKLTTENISMEDFGTILEKYSNTIDNHLVIEHDGTSYDIKFKLKSLNKEKSFDITKIDYDNLTPEVVQQLVEYYNQFEIEDPPTDNDVDGHKMWMNSKNQLHRDNDRPAYVFKTAIMGWWVNGNLHREVGPARILNDGSCEYWLNGTKYSKEEWLKLVNKKKQQ